MSDHFNSTSAPVPGDIDNEMLTGYLKGELSPEAKHRVEEAMLDSPALSDVIEGLEAIQNTRKLTTLQSEIEDVLRVYLTSKKKRRDYRHAIKGTGWILISTIILLLLLLVGFVVVYMRNGQ